MRSPQYAFRVWRFFLSEILQLINHGWRTWNVKDLPFWIDWNVVAIKPRSAFFSPFRSVFSYNFFLFRNCVNGLNLNWQSMQLFLLQRVLPKWGEVGRASAVVFAFWFWLEFSASANSSLFLLFCFGSRLRDRDLRFLFAEWMRI